MLKYEIAYRKGIDLLTGEERSRAKTLPIYANNKPVLNMSIKTLRGMMELVHKPVESSGYFVVDSPSNPLERNIVGVSDTVQSQYHFHTHPPTLYRGEWVPPTSDDLMDTRNDYLKDPRGKRKGKGVKLRFVFTPNEIFILRYIKYIIFTRRHVAPEDIIKMKLDVSKNEYFKLGLTELEDILDQNNLLKNELKRVLNGAIDEPPEPGVIDYEFLENDYINKCGSRLGVDVQVIHKDEIEHLLNLNDDFLLRIQI